MSFRFAKAKRNLIIFGVKYFYENCVSQDCVALKHAFAPSCPDHYQDFGYWSLSRKAVFQDKKKGNKKNLRSKMVFSSLKIKIKPYFTC